MELMPIVHNTINNNNNNQDENSEITDIQINTNNFSTRILYIYKCVDVMYLALLHTFLLSVFETIFYWSYVTIQEKEALLRRLDSFKFIFDLICNNINNEDLKSQIGDYIKQQDDEKEVNNEDDKIMQTTVYNLKVVTNYRKELGNLNKNKNILLS